MARRHKPDDLAEALQVTVATRWAGTRNAATIACQARKALAYLADINITRASQVDPDVLGDMVDLWVDQGYAPTTINARLSALSVLGVTMPTGDDRVSVKPNRMLKWWLRPEVYDRLMADERVPQWTRDAVALIYQTGMRVEEALRCECGDAVHRSTGGIDLTVRGTKTDASHRVIALNQPAEELWGRLKAQAKRRGHVSGRVLPYAYEQLAAEWREIRKVRKWTTVPGSTLKALRRSAARHLTINGMPTIVLMKYLGHSNITTTEGYLRLTGGISTDEQRRWL